MSVVDDSLDERDIAQLAAAHVDALPESLVSRVGERYARAFYRYLAASPDELILVTRQAGGRLSGACIVSLRPSTLTRRLVTRTPLALHAPFALGRLPLVAMATAERGGPSQPDGPEILLIFTAPESRSQGQGAALLARAEALLASRGIRRLFVKTRDDAGNRANGFYRRAGFATLATLSKFGKRLVLFEKAIA